MSISYNEYLSLYQSYLDYLRAIQTPIQVPTQTPIQAPIQVPTQTPIQAPIQTPIQAPIQTPTQTPIQAPIQRVFAQPTIYRPPIIDNVGEVLSNRFMGHYESEGGQYGAETTGDYGSRQ